ncbi:hypothetical protein J2Y48_003155 [Mycoplana sp. BE70]|uniref:hypothetical protein n=1 Tax=Mycoplana sp. BE70 TaxID=2817775 RepID=UPI00285743F3|nr:hypothetical protein [Mycoplana sp. BE70]MDR6757858.1 hypothetical protein [Mycoplana sp. BE70]
MRKRVVGAPSITGATVEPPSPIIKNPTPRFSMDENVDYHVILDQELDQLSQPENGVVGTIGFTALGAALAFVPAMVSALEKLGDPLKPLERTEIATLLLTPGCIATAIVCLILFSISKYRNRGLVERIRRRPRRSAG